MQLFKSEKFKLFIFLTVLLIVTCSPIWGVKYFVNHDGSAHLYSASLMIEILSGNPEITKYVELNSFAIPNASGHWVLSLLLLIFSPFTVTKIIVTLTYILFVCAIGWLRLKTVGRDGLYTSMLIGAVIGFNWLWFMGFYNFISGLIGFAFTLGLYYSWREKLNVLRIIFLSIILILVYLSHLISFGVLAASILWLSFFVERKKILKTLIYTIIALLPVMPLIYIYKSISASGGGFYPGWNITDPFSISGWITQIRTADALIIISRKSFPFVNFDSGLFAVFTPMLWLLVVFFLLTLTTFYKNNFEKSFLAKIFPFLFLFLGAIFLTVFAPDNFGTIHGWILRERILLCGLLFFIPIFRFNSLKFLKNPVKVILICIILYQTAAVWEYSLKTNSMAEEFLTVSQKIPENDSLLSVIMIEDSPRFHATPELNMNNLNGLSHKHFIWDNYELAYFVFSIKTVENSDQNFIRLLVTSNAFALTTIDEEFEEKLSRLETALSENSEKIDTLILWRRNQRVEAILSKWFEPTPYYESGNVRLYKRIRK